MHMPPFVCSCSAIRDLIASAGPVIFIVIGLLVAAYWWLDPQPPKQVTLATGPAGSAYAELRQALCEGAGARAASRSS